MRATYNITNDKLKAWFAERLSKDNYDRARRLGFTFWHGSKCFTAKWSPRAEDFIREMGIETIEADDQPDDVEARVDRFAKYAGEAEQAAESSQTYLEERANTERRRANAVSSIEKNLSAAEHWQQRIEGAIRHAAYKEKPDVIARRIRGLEADKRKHERDSQIDEKVKPDTDSEGVIRYWVGHGRGGSWRTVAQIEADKPWHDRWIAHITRRLEYENACLVAAGGCPEVLRPERRKAVQPKGVQKTQKGGTPEELGAAGFRPYFDSKGPITWRLITRVNRRTVEVMSAELVTKGDGKPLRRFMTRKEDIYRISELKTRSEVQVEMPELHEQYEDYENLLRRIAEIKTRKAAERGKEYERLDAIRAAAGADAINAETGELIFKKEQVAA